MDSHIGGPAITLHGPLKQEKNTMLDHISRISFTSICIDQCGFPNFPPKYFLSLL
jgi:hypothetical protein